MEDLVVSLVAKGLTTGEVQAHLAEIYGTEASRQTISTITDRVLEDLAEWQNRPLDPVYPVLFIDAINVKTATATRQPADLRGAWGHGRWRARRAGLLGWRARRR
jgi:transposase-like protein